MTGESAVYVMGTMRGPKKVGYAAQPQRRLCDVRRRHGRQIAILEVWPMPIDVVADVEAVAHMILHAQRVRGEWFRGPLDRIGEAIDTACGVVEDRSVEIDLPEIRRVAGAARARAGLAAARQRGRIGGATARYTDAQILEFAKLSTKPGARKAGMSVPGFIKAKARAVKRKAEQEAKRRAKRR